MNKTKLQKHTKTIKDKKSIKRKQQASNKPKIPEQKPFKPQNFTTDKILIKLIESNRLHYIRTHTKTFSLIKRCIMSPLNR